MADVYCRNLTCPNNDGSLYRDGKGAVGYCKLEEVGIDKDGRCEDDGE